MKISAQRFARIGFQKRGGCSGIPFSYPPPPLFFLTNSMISYTPLGCAYFPTQFASTLRFVQCFNIRAAKAKHQALSCSCRACMLFFLTFSQLLAFSFFVRQKAVSHEGVGGSQSHFPMGWVTKYFKKKPFTCPLPGSLPPTCDECRTPLTTTQQSYRVVR